MDSINFPYLSNLGVNGNGSTAAHFDIDANAFKSILGRWMRGGGERYSPLDVLNSATAVNVLGELSIGGTLMRGSQPNSAIRNKTYFLCDLVGKKMY